MANDRFGMFLQFPQASRSAPPEVSPVVRDGVRYEQLEGLRLPGIDPDSGHVVAFDDATDTVVWTAEIYRVEPLPHLAGIETDVLKVFFASMKLSADGQQLLIVDERARHFTLDLATRSVRQTTDNAR